MDTGSIANTNKNISSLVSNPGTISTIKNTSPQTFGDQAVKVGTALAIKAVLNNPLVKLEAKKLELVAEGIKLSLAHSYTLNFTLYAKHTPKKQVKDGVVIDIPAELDDEQYNKAVENENKNYAEAVKLLNEKKKKNQEDIDEYLKDPFKKQREARKKRREARKKRKRKTKEEKRAARKKLWKAIKSNAKKTLVPILSLLLVEYLGEIIAQNDEIKKLIDDTNAIITAANESGDPLQLDKAKLARDNALRVINDNEAKIRNVESTIGQITLYIGIFEIILSILSSIPIPTSVPPGIGLPINVITRILVLLEKANKIILALSAFLPIILLSLERAIMILEDYKSQLLDINGELEIAGSQVPNNLNFGNLGTYKGFNLVLKEENDPKFIVRGNKRHYAVAISKSGVISAQSDYSFTLDPTDLVEQLKLIIDKQNLQS
jgi:hypothetical protein